MPLGPWIQDLKLCTKTVTVREQRPTPCPQALTTHRAAHPPLAHDARGGERARLLAPATTQSDRRGRSEHTAVGAAVALADRQVSHPTDAIAAAALPLAGKEQVAE